MLPCLLAAPTAVSVGGRPLLARPLSLGDFALLLRNGADALGLEGDAGDLPGFGDPAFQAWLEGPGAPLLLWCALRRDQDISLAECREMAGDAEGVAACLAAGLRRARSARPPAGRGKDVARLDWGAVLYRRYAEGMMPAAWGDMALDQAHLIAAGGEGFDPDEEASRALLDDAQRRWEAMQGPGDEPRPSPSGPVPEGVTPEVMAEVEAMGLRLAGGGDVG